MAAFLSALAQLALTLLAASVLIFLAVNILPGDPAELLLGINADPAALAALRTEMGLDRPFFVRFVDWLGGIAVGDFGRSLTYDVPVSGLIAERLAVSVPLAVLALVMSVGLALPAGVLAATWRGGRLDRTILGGALVGLSIPNVWLGLLLIAVFAVSLGLMPAGGFPGWSAGFGPALAALLMPAVSLAIPQAAILTRMVRTSVAEAADEDFVMLARAKGRTQFGAVTRHALGNAWSPILTIIGLQFGFLIAGAIVIETVFSLPGLGRLLFQAVSQRDFPVVGGVVLIVVGTVIVANAVCDGLGRIADPRSRRR